MRAKCTKNVLLNTLIIIPTMTYLSTRTKVKARFEGFPSLGELFGHLVFLYFMDDTFVYVLHRASHETPLLYNLHKVHHQHDALYTWANLYIHPV